MAAKKTNQRPKTTPAPKPPIERKELSVTAQQLVDYLNTVNESAKCSFCGVGDYAVPSDPTGTTASLVATPVPHVKGIGLWLYTAVCANCAHVVFFHAPAVSAKIIKD